MTAALLELRHTTPKARTELALPSSMGELEGMAMYSAGGHARISHPRPGPRLEGEGDLVWLNIVVNQLSGSLSDIESLLSVVGPMCASIKDRAGR